MADNEQNTSSGQVRSFDKALNEDVNDFHLPSNEWTQARNAINNSITGDLGKLGNEPGNKECIRLTYLSATITGFIYIIEDYWLVYSTDGAGTSEIGLFQEGTCSYLTLVNDSCLGFTLENLIKGVARSTSACTYKAYWDDGLNPSRNMEFNIPDDMIAAAATPTDPNLNPNYYTNPDSAIPWIQTCVDLNGGLAGGCILCTNTPALDCNKIRLALLIKPICIRVERGYAGGNLLNGSYMVAMAYAVKGQKISDLYVSNIQPLFDQNNSASSLDVFIDDIDLTYDEVIVYTISTINQQTVVRQAGLYSTRQTRLSFDTIFDTWPAFPIEQVPIMSPIVNKSDAMYNVGDYLLRVGPTSKEDFNYQPFANQIVCKWQSVEYPSDYYEKGGNEVGYMRDEVYPFFIQWIYDTGDESASYHIPGRPGTILDKSSVAPLSGNSIYADDDKYWKVNNTATQTGTLSVPLPDGGVLVGEGLMGYWESSEFYPDNKPEIWNVNDLSHPWTVIITPPYSGTNVGSIFPAVVFGDYDLCGQPIRHHKFPEDSALPESNIFVNGGSKIRVMGVTFENIRTPRDNNGNVIPGIVGYKILRGTRNGNKTIIAKGMINNLRSYTIPGGTETGLLPNYPFNDLGNDDYLSINRSKTLNDIVTTPGGIFPAGVGSGPYNFAERDFTFHSPDTNFNNPFLATKEIKVYGTIWGQTKGRFELSEKHPKEKLISNLSFLLASVGGLGLAVLAANGTRRTKFINPQTGYSQSSITLSGYTTGTGLGQPATSDLPAIAISQGFNTAADALKIAADAFITKLANSVFTGASVSDGYGVAQILADSGAVGSPFNKPHDVVQEPGYLDNLGGLSGGIAPLVAFPMFLNAFATGTDSIIELIRAMLQYRDFVVRYHAHGDFKNFDTSLPMIRSLISEQRYLNPELAQLQNGKVVNNLYRSRTVYFGTDTAPNFNLLGVPNHLDDSRFTGKDKNKLDLVELLKDTYYDNCASLYGALKVRIRNQYGQLNNIIQLPVGSCYTKVKYNSLGQLIDDLGNPLLITTSKTATLFGGDVYINRYTEKNTCFFFYDWLEGQPNGAQFDYSSNIMVPYPKYWANFNGFQTNDFTAGVIGAISGGSIPSLSSGTPADPLIPSDYYALDGATIGGTTISSITNNFKFDKRGWFYLFNSGVRDFFVESEINTAYREQGPLESQKFYDPYRGGSTKDLFKTEFIKAGNYYKYDISLSVTKLFSNYVSWAAMQSPQYNPNLAETCFVYQDSRVMYSLPAQFEGLKDGWKVFLTNNYYDFDNVPTCIKPINKSGAIIFFDAASPVQFQGTDQLQTSLGTKLTIGDGGLFSQPLQALVNVENSHEYGSCQNRLSVINTPAGVFWMSQNQGKIFTVVGNGIKAISDENMKWWFATFLPYQIVKDFPSFELLDNPVIGVACQSVYDNENGLLYFCKKDYSLKTGLSETLTYMGGNNFQVDQTGLVLEIGNPNSPWDLYFDDASWTISYDPKGKGEWLSLHDWHPNFCLPGKNTFLTVNPLDRNSLWIHNERCDLYCNYYGIDYPFEVEFTVNTGQDVNSLRSIQYILECYKYAPNCYDRFHVLDFNFDEATVYNTEQTSGLLKLVLNPKNDPTAILQYPIINPTNINVLFSKEENKYRFNQFWDITEDRGEFFNPLIPGFAQRAIWDTQPNGYIRLLNANNLNYNKADFQKKKFRHYTVSVLLRKLVSGDRKMLVMLSDVKNLLSPR